MSNFLGTATDDAVVNTLTLNGSGSTVLSGMGAIRLSLTPTQVAAATASRQTFTCPGVKAGDFLGVSSAPGGVVLCFPTSVRSVADGSIQVTFSNVDPTNPQTPPAGVYVVFFAR